MSRPRTTLLIPEPTPRPDGLCVVCDKPIPATASRYAPPDAFCRTRCCREWFGNVDPVYYAQEGRDERPQA